VIIIFFSILLKEERSADSKVLGRDYLLLAPEVNFQYWLEGLKAAVTKIQQNGVQDGVDAFSRTDIFPIIHGNNFFQRPH
jgi:hypothetical protein